MCVPDANLISEEECFFRSLCNNWQVADSKAGLLKNNDAALIQRLLD